MFDEVAMKRIMENGPEVLVYMSPTGNVGRT